MKKKWLAVAALSVAAAWSSQAALVAYWDFEEGEGTTTTEKVSSTVSGALPTGASWTTGGAANSTAALAFANGGRLETGLNANDLGIAGSGAKTIVAWINTTTTVQDAFLGYSPVNGSGSGTELRFLVNGNGGDTTGKLRMEVSGGGFEFGSGFNDGNWHMVAFIINASDGINDVDVYADGTYTTRSLGGTTINTIGTVVDIPQNGNGFVLGSDGNAGRHFNGLLDDVAIFDAALTAAELNDIRVNGVIPEPGTLGLVAAFGGAIALIRRKLML